MPEELSTTPQGGQTQPTGETPVSTTAQTNEEPFDKERAMATINKLREFEKTAKALQKKVDEYEAEKKKAQAAELSEADRLKAQLAEIEARHAAAQGELNALKLRAEIAKEAEKQKVKFASATAREDAVEILARVVTFEDGKVQGLEDALKLLVKEREYLIEKEPKLVPPITNAKANGKGNQPDLEARKKELAQRFRLNI